MDIIDDFLPVGQFAELRSNVCSLHFDWHFSPVVTFDDEEGPSPGLLTHIVYENNIPFDPLYHKHFVPILEQLNPEFKPYFPDSAVVIIWRIRANLNYRLLEPYKYLFHSDISLDDRVAADWTTSILYMNTNNGYTELETGEKVDCVENRLVTFPANVKHRGVTQTDEQTRIVINFNYLKMTDSERK